MSYRPLPEPPEAAVLGGEFEFGRFGAPFPRVNLLEVRRPYHYPVPRFVKELRLKEWRSLLFGDGRWHFLAVLYDAKLFSAVVFQAWDRADKRRTGFRRIIPGSAFRHGDRLDGSRLAWKTRHASLALDCSLGGGGIALEVERAARRGERGFSGSFRLAWGPRHCSPSVSCLPLGLNRAMYSTRALLPLEGSFRLGEEEFALGGAGAMGIFGDEKGYYPWRMRYDRVSGFGLDAKGRRTGFSLTVNQVKDPARHTENCVWIGNRVWTLPPVRVTRATGPAGEWVVQDVEGLVDLVFVPQVPNDLRARLGLVQGDFHGPLGSFRGFVKNGEGEKLDAERLTGMGESQDLRA